MTNGGTPFEGFERDEDDEEPPPRVHLDPRELDRAYEIARAVTQPVVEIAFLATATVGAILTAWGRAKRRARKRMAEKQRRTR